jgi:hypothetical protein
MPIDTIDTIKSRMIRNASKIWGYAEVQDMNAFDPVLGLLIGALAEELYRISREINQSDTRVINKLLDILFARNLFTHFPAHGIAYAEPVRPQVVINELYQFYASRNSGNMDSGKETREKKDLFFSPPFPCNLFDGKIKYLIAGTFLYEVNGRLKEMVAEASEKASQEVRTLLLGIKMNPLIEYLDGLSLFFTFKNIRPDSRFYHTLQSSKWSINGKEVDFHQGMDSIHAEDPLANFIKRDSDITYRSIGFVRDFYQANFMTLDARNYRLADFFKDHYEPTVLKERFKGQKVNFADQDVVWLSIDLSQPVSLEEMDDLVVSINCFPVINRELNEFTYSIVKGMNIVPLSTEDFFFDLRSVTDSEDRVYRPLDSANLTGEEGLTCYVRQEGVTRFDSRDAREAIKQLTDLVRDEAAAFSAQGTDLISHELKQLDQILSRLEQRMNSSGDAHEPGSYLILESTDEYDKIQVQFWSIAGDRANNIRPGTKLSVYNGMDVDDKSLVLYTHTVGGRQKLTREDKLNTLRRSLLSKGRVVTKEDIKALCFELFGKDLQNVEVKKGVALDSSPGKGMTRTLDVHLFLKEKNSVSAEDLAYKTRSLKVRLSRESVNLLPYRVFINQRK